MYAVHVHFLYILYVSIVSEHKQRLSTLNPKGLYFHTNVNKLWSKHTTTPYSHSVCLVTSMYRDTPVIFSHHWFSNTVIYDYNVYIASVWRPIDISEVVWQLWNTREGIDHFDCVHAYTHESIAYISLMFCDNSTIRVCTLCRRYQPLHLCDAFVDIR